MRRKHQGGTDAQAEAEMIFRGIRHSCFVSRAETEMLMFPRLRCHQILIFSWFFFPLLLHNILFFLIIFAGRRFKRCRTITNSHDLLLHFFYFLIHKILKHGPEGKSQLPFKCEYLWIFGRNTFKSRLCAWLPFKTGTCLQKYVDKIHISPNCESDQQCPWARVVKRTHLIYFNLIWF